MQQPAYNYPLEKDKDILEKGWHLDAETERSQCGPENSNSDSVPWKLPATQPLSCMGKTKAPSPEEQPQALRASPLHPLRSLSKKQCENQGSLLHFDRQAPGRISTSPTLRRLRGSGCGMKYSLPQQEASEGPTWGGWKEPAGSPCYLSKSLPGSPKISSHSSSLRLCSRLPLDPTRVLDAADSFEPQAEPTDEAALPVSLPVHEGCLFQASLPGRGSHSLPSPVAQLPRPQGEELHQSRCLRNAHVVGFRAQPAHTMDLQIFCKGQNKETYQKGDKIIPTTMGLVPSDLTSLGTRNSGFYEHRRSSVVLNLPELEVFPGDLLVSEGAAHYLCHPLLLLNSESKKPRWPFSKRGVGKDRHKHISDLETCLSSVKIADFRAYEFQSLKGKTWNEVVETHQKLPTDQLDLRKQQEAMWELFTSECTYFLDHLLVLKMIFMNTLKYLQTYEYLLDVDLWRLFANLEELSQTSFGFVSSLFAIIKDYFDASETSPSMDFIPVLMKYLRGSLCQSHQTYCLNYSAAVFYLESLKQRDDFGIYLKCYARALLYDPEKIVQAFSENQLFLQLQKSPWQRITSEAWEERLPRFPDLAVNRCTCGPNKPGSLGVVWLRKEELSWWCEQNEQCRRLHLSELLVAPLHRLTRYPLLLKNIWKRSTDATEKIMIYSIKEKVEKSIRDLEGKVKWLDNFQKFRHLQEIIVWPPLWDRDKRFFIPECLKHIFKEHMAENILSPTNRHLLYEGKLTLAESTRFLDVYLFLFDDFLLVTKTKRNKKKAGGSDTGVMCPSLTPELQTVIKEGGSCTVLDQPIPLDRLVVKSIDPLHVSVFGLRNAFLVQHENRYRQCIAAFLLQAQTENIKKTWMAQITAAIACFTKSRETKKIPLFPSRAESSEI